MRWREKRRTRGIVNIGAAFHLNPALPASHFIPWAHYLVRSVIVGGGTITADLFSLCVATEEMVSKRK
jgi:hypothetical protein